MPQMRQFRCSVSFGKLLEQFVLILGGSIRNKQLPNALQNNNIFASCSSELEGSKQSPQKLTDADTDQRRVCVTKAAIDPKPFSCLQGATAYCKTARTTREEKRLAAFVAAGCFLKPSFSSACPCPAPNTNIHAIYFTSRCAARLAHPGNGPGRASFFPTLMKATTQALLQCSIIATIAERIVVASALPAKLATMASPAFFTMRS